MNKLYFVCSNCGESFEIETEGETTIQCLKCFSVWHYWFNQKEDRYEIDGTIEGD